MPRKIALIVHAEVEDRDRTGVLKLKKMAAKFVSTSGSMTR